MPPLDFPNTPTNGTTFTGGLGAWIYDGAKWNPQAATSGFYLPLSGGTMTGPIVLAADPTTALQAATKQYVDAHAGSGGGVSVTISDTAPASPVAGALWWDSVSGQLYISYTDPNSTEWVVANSGVMGAYLPLAGGTLTGPLILAADPTVALGAVTKQYSDTKLALAGGTMTGLLVLSGNATANLNPVTLQQLNSTVGAYVPLAGGTMTGVLNINAATAVGLNVQINTAYGFVGLALTNAAAGGRTYFVTSTDNTAGVGGGKFGVWDNTAGAYRLLIDSSGNATFSGALGIGATAPPSDAYAGSVWPTQAIVLPYTSTGGVITTNAYRNGSKLLAAGAACSFNMGNGIFQFYSAPSAAAGAAPAWFGTASLDAAGNLTLAANLFLISNNVWFAGATSVGPRMYGDGTNIAWQLGSGNGSYTWYNNSGGAALTLTAGGNLTNAGYLYVQGSPDAGQATIQAGFSRNRWRFAVSAGDNGAAGTLDYRGYDSNALSIVGAGTSPRFIRLWDFTTVNNALGVGTTPQNNAINGTLQIQDTLCIAGTPGSAIFYNAYHGTSGSYYINSAPATAFNMDGGGFSWYTAASGSAGAGVGWTQIATLNSAGTFSCANVNVGSTLNVSGYINSNGSNAAVTWQQRDNTGIQWLWYSTGGWARLWNSTNGDCMLFVATQLIPNVVGTAWCGSNTNYWSNVYSNAFSNTSDIRLKTDLKDLPECLPFVMRLNPQRFRWLGEKNPADPQPDIAHWGFVAQHVGEAFKDHEFGGYIPSFNGGAECVNYQELTAVLWKAVQELSAKVARLEGAR